MRLPIRRAHLITPLRRQAAWALALALMVASTAASAVPATLPVQGIVADDAGVPLNGVFPVTFTLYSDAAGTNSVFTETRNVTFTDGFFAEQLGDLGALDLAALSAVDGAWLGVAVDDDSEMDLIALGSVAFAASAAFCEEAQTLQGLSPSDLTLATDNVDFSRITNLPADLSDGDDDTTYAPRAAGGLELVNGEFALLSSCTVGHVLKRTAGGWDCAADETGAGGGSISTVTLNGTTLTITEDGTPYSVDLASLQDGVNDADSSTTNELNSSLMLSGTTLQLTDNGGTLSVNLAGLQDGVNDADSSTTNELNTSLSLSGTTLSLTDPGGTLTANLAALQDGVNDADADPSNETNLSMSLSGSTLSVTDSAGSVSADLSALPNGNRMLTNTGSTTTPTATRAFLSAVVTAAVTSTELIHIQSTVSMGSTSVGGAASLDIYPCYRLSSSTATPTAQGLGIYNLTAAEGQRTTFTISGVFTGLSGTYQFGMCGDDNGNGNWNNNEWSYSTLIINRP